MRAGFVAQSLSQIIAARAAATRAGTLPDFVRSTSMMDVIMLAIGFAAFALSIGYVYACDRL